MEHIVDALGDQVFRGAGNSCAFGHATYLINWLRVAVLCSIVWRGSFHLLSCGLPAHFCRVKKLVLIGSLQRYKELENEGIGCFELAGKRAA